MSIIVERFEAVVTDNQDPDEDFRIKVKCAGVLGDEESNLPFWIQPCFDWGWVYVPDVDEQVEIEMVVSSDQDESFGQSIIEAPDLRWRGKRYYSNDEENPTIFNDIFKENYGKRRGFATPNGHYFVFDDTDDKRLISLNWQNGDDDFTKISIENDGALKIERSDKATLHLKDDELEMLLDGNGAGVKITGKDGDTVTLLGDNAVKVAIADHLQTLWGDLKLWLDTHTHPTPAGPSSPSTVPGPSWNSAISSSKLKIPDG